MRRSKGFYKEYEVPEGHEALTNCDLGDFSDDYIDRNSPDEVGYYQFIPDNGGVREIVHAKDPQQACFIALFESMMPL